MKIIGIDPTNKWMFPIVLFIIVTGAVVSTLRIIGTALVVFFPAIWITLKEVYNNDQR